MKALKGLATFTLLAILLMLALRLTMTESLRETLGQKAAHLAAQSSDKSTDLAIVGPATTLGLASTTAGLAALAALCAALAKSIPTARVAKLLLIGLIIALALNSACHAANRFNPLIGAADLATALLAGWSISVLCGPKLLADRGRQIVIAALIAILAAWTTKGFYQYFVEIPDTIRFYFDHKAEQLVQNGIDPANAYQVQLFESRLTAKEVSGFLSLSNVTAAGLIGLLTLLAALVALGVRTLAFPPVLQSKIKNQKSKIAPSTSHPKTEIPLPVLLTILAAILLLAGLVISILTGSRGGSILSIVCSLIIAAAIFFQRQILVWRKTLLLLLITCIPLAVAAVISYGLTHDALPSKSLTFRWHYWTAAAKLIDQCPLAGVGLNNFGDYYLSVKRPSSPEDVTDPHSFFVRLAAELGLPATILVAILVGWQIASAIKLAKPREKPGDPIGMLALPAIRPSIIVMPFVLCISWWTLHYFMADPPNVVFLYMALILANIAAAAAALSRSITAPMVPAHLRLISLAALLGALGMLAYDQINMALVTGSVAMLFWILLALADSYDPPPVRRAPLLRSIPVVLLVGAVSLSPLFLHYANAWNPAPHEYACIQALSQTPSNSQAALSEIDAAVTRSPRTLELLTTRIKIKQQLHLPVAEDIRHILTLDRANAPIRVHLATADSDLPPKEAAQILEQALALNAQLPLDESKRLPPTEITGIQNLITELKKLPDSQTLNP